MNKFGAEKHYADAQEISFSKYSMQYQAIILIVPLFFIFCMKELTGIIKLAKFGVISVLLYGLFILYSFIDNLQSGRVAAKWDSDLKYFSNDVAGVAGSFALAFFIHNCVC
jgi:sodium-coupled neutral amino acid transporter 9